MVIGDWERVKELLHQAMQLAPEDRKSFLDRVCDSNDAVRAEVESLLVADEGVRASFMQFRPSGEPGANTDENSQNFSTLRVGQIFAERFRVVRELGEGGMGQVWLAEQNSPVRRQVALKLIRAGMYDGAAVQRFQSERQSLAMMDHPTIAKVFDAGATPQGQPYFVMEYVPGQPITEYCDRKKLKIEDRLELFICVCEGVQHAHQKAIIHRDLKPANILVVEVDGKPVPRIIDFGLAKAITTEFTGETILTHLGSLVGTPGYMSPEQADPSVPDIDTRTDVYSLGVVLYVLLTGSQPLDTKQWKNRPLDELLRKLREEEPPTPSTKVNAERDTGSAHAEARGTEPKRLVSLLRGDLDWITMKALEKDRARRYGAPSELAADLRRYLNHEPVEARPASVGYRLRKYTRRHRVAVGVATGLLLLLAAFSILQAVQLRRITQERDRATRERDRASRITDFMTGMFKISDPSQARGNSITAREILDKSSKDIRTGLTKDPEVQSQMMSVMSRTYAGLGLYPQAYDLAKGALDSRLQLLGPTDPKTLESEGQVGVDLAYQGHYDDAEKMLRQAVEGERRVLGTDDRLTLETMDRWAAVRGLQGHYDEEEKLERGVIETGARKLGPENEQLFRARTNLVSALWNLARYADAEQEGRQLVALERRVLGPDAPGTLLSMGNLALVLKSEGRYSEAEAQNRELLAADQRVLGPEHPATANTMENLSSLLIEEGHLPEAETLSREALAIRTHSLGPDHPDTLVSKINLSIVLFKEGRLGDAEQLQREALATSIRVQGAEHPRSLEMQTDLAQTLNAERHYAAAEKLARATYEAELRIHGPQHPHTVNTLRELGTALAHTRRYAEAGQLFRDTIHKQETQDNSKAQGNLWSVWYSFACVAAAGDHPDDSLQYLQEAINRGYKDADGLINDDDLKSLRTNPKFQQLVAELKRQATK
jgi:eukaryotic-like serine/threonine-protein kinase